MTKSSSLLREYCAHLPHGTVHKRERDATKVEMLRRGEQASPLERRHGPYSEAVEEEWVSFSLIEMEMEKFVIGGARCSHFYLEE